jgi:hypothetical protein
LVAMVQFATLWRVVILDPRIAKFHYPRRNFLSGFFFFTRILVWWVLRQWAVFLFFHFFNFSLYSFDMFFCLIKFL